MLFTYLLVADVAKISNYFLELWRALETPQRERLQAANDTFSFDLTVKACASWGGNYLYGQCQLIIDLVITCFPLRTGRLIYKANTNGEDSPSCP